MNPVLLTVWAVLTACFLALLVYRGQLTRYEDEQLFLNDSTNSNEEQQQQANLVRRINRLQPLVRGVGAAAGPPAPSESTSGTPGSAFSSLPLTS